MSETKRERYIRVLEDELKSLTMKMHHEAYFHEKTIKGILQLLKEEPRVIRCKDCKFNASSKKCLHPDSFFLVPSDDDFCSYAERKEE